jgi:hypothetical protein
VLVVGAWRTTDPTGETGPWTYVATLVVTVTRVGVGTAVLLSFVGVVRDAFQHRQQNSRK